MKEGGFGKGSAAQACGVTEEHKWELFDKFQDGLVAVKQFLLTQVLEPWNIK